MFALAQSEIIKFFQDIEKGIKLWHTESSSQNGYFQTEITGFCNRIEQLPMKDGFTGLKTALQYTAEFIEQNKTSESLLADLAPYHLLVRAEFYLAQASAIRLIYKPPPFIDDKHSAMEETALNIRHLFEQGLKNCNGRRISLATNKDPDPKRVEIYMRQSALYKIGGDIHTFITRQEKIDHGESKESLNNELDVLGWRLLTHMQDMFQLDSQKGVSTGFANSFLLKYLRLTHEVKYQIENLPQGAIYNTRQFCSKLLQAYSSDRQAFFQPSADQGIEFRIYDNINTPSPELYARIEKLTGQYIITGDGKGQLGFPEEVKYKSYYALQNKGMNLFEMIIGGKLAGYFILFTDHNNFPDVAKEGLIKNNIVASSTTGWAHLVAIDEEMKEVANQRTYRILASVVKTVAIAHGLTELVGRVRDGNPAISAHIEEGFLVVSPLYRSGNYDFRLVRCDLNTPAYDLPPFVSFKPFREVFKDN